MKIIIKFLTILFVINNNFGYNGASFNDSTKTKNSEQEDGNIGA